MNSANLKLDEARGSARRRFHALMYKSLPPLQPLIAFEAAARLGSFKRTAAELHLTASAISQQMRALEEALGLELFRRQHRETVLTEAGTEYAQVVRQLLQALERETHRIKDRARRRILRLSADAYFVYEHFIPRMDEFAAQSPGVDLRVEASTAVVDLMCEPIDAAIRFSVRPPAHPGLWSQLLARQTLSLVAAPSVAAAVRTREQLAAAPVVCIEGRFDDVWGSLGARLGIEWRPQRTLFVDSYYAMVQAAERGQGVGFALRPGTDPRLDTGTLVELPQTAIPDWGAFYLVCRRTEVDDPDLQAVLAWVAELLRPR